MQWVKIEGARERMTDGRNECRTSNWVTRRSCRVDEVVIGVSVVYRGIRNGYRFARKVDLVF